MVRPGPVLLLVVAAVSGACASTGRARPSPFPVPGGEAPPATAPAAPSASGSEVADLALSFLGTPYRNGGDTPAGFDCSGFVEYVFARNGIAVPRTVAEQYREGRRIDRDDLQAGDLVFFSTVARGASHVGISIGGDEFVHAPSERGEVRIEHMSARYWASRWVGARRIGG